MFENSDQTVFLIDIPASIGAAQGTAEHPFSRTLLSTAALEVPFVSTEPKTAKARKNVADRLDAAVDHDGSIAEFEQLIQDALEEIRGAYFGPWCRRRMHAADVLSKKSKLGFGSEPTSSLYRALIKEAYSPSVNDQEPSPYKHTYTFSLSIPSSPWIPTHINSSAQPKTLHITPPILPQPSIPFSFHIPPSSSFHLLPCPAPPPHSLPKHSLDIILLDPPWPNHSARRKRAYPTARTTADVRALLTALDLPSLLAADGFVGLWVTNKPAIRRLVLAAGGLFAEWGAVLVEEWLWVKTTIGGEPVTAVGGVWRKPYEVFLLGKRSGDTAPSVSVKKRVIFGVPDLHSRKPCFKTLLERLVLPPKYEALEIFARHLTAGWRSWGNEVIMFNWEGYWVHNDDLTDIGVSSIEIDI
jgi:N6-adenosine-specific RNA methylase IME4